MRHGTPIEAPSRGWRRRLRPLRTGDFWLAVLMGGLVLLGVAAALKILAEAVKICIAGPTC